jgi:DNA polymerase-3 subunit beta
MNIIVIKEKLKEGLDAAIRASSEHPTLPILKNILIEAKDDKITLTATNLEIGMRYNLSGKIAEAGGVTVPAGLLSQIISNLSDERVELSAEGPVLNIITESYKASIQGAPAAEFPILPLIENTEEYIEADSALFKSSLEATLSAAQFSELRPELSSVYLQFFGDRIVLVATDSFRLAEKTLADNQFTATVSGEFKVLLPLRTAQELTRILREKGSIKIYRDQSQILFKTERLELISRLLEGTFPDYRAVIPKEYQAEVSVDRDEFLNAVKLAGVMSGAGSETALRPGTGDTLEIFSRDEKLGENSYQLAAKTKGSFKEASFNWKYLLEGAKAMPPKEFVLGLNDDNKPAILKSRQDSSYFYILMPILKG